MRLLSSLVSNSTFSRLGGTLAALLLVAFVAAGCSDSTSPSGIASFSITPSNPPELAVNQTQDFDIVARNADGDIVQFDGTVNWSSSDPSVATVDANGVATAQAAGSADIDATISGQSADAPASLNVLNLVAQPSASTTSSSLMPSSSSSGSAEFQVAVNDLDGNAVSGLSAGAFSIPDVSFNGGTVSFTAQSVSAPPALSIRGAAKAPVGSGPFSAALVIDQSGSMGSTDPQDARLASAKQFAQEMESGDESALYTFTSAVSQELGMTSDPATISDQVDQIGAPGGSTALYDAGVEACNFVASNAANGSNMYVVLLTDGADNASTNTEADLINACNSAGVKVITVGFAGSLPEVLARVANQTGGVVVFDTDVNALLSAVRSLPPIMRGDRNPSVVNFSVSASGVDLTAGGQFSGTIDVNFSGNSLSTPFWVQW